MTYFTSIDSPSSSSGQLDDKTHPLPKEMPKTDKSVQQVVKKRLRDSSTSFLHTVNSAQIQSERKIQCRRPHPGSRTLRRPPEWANKKPCLFMGQIQLNGTFYKVKKVGAGSFHLTYEFLDSEFIELNGQKVSLSDLVLKTINYGVTNPKKVPDLVRTDLIGYESLKKNDIPVAHFYAEPTTFEDLDPKNGMFWIVEKMDEKISGEEWKTCKTFEELDAKSQMILSFAKKWLTKMAVEKKDLINDFRKRNTMLKGDEIKIVDPGKPEDDKDDIKYLIGRYAVDWANGNQIIFDWLTSDFPEEMRTLGFTSDL